MRHDVINRRRQLASAPLRRPAGRRLHAVRIDRPASARREIRGYLLILVLVCRAAPFVRYGCATAGVQTRMCRAFSAHQPADNATTPAK